MKKKSINSDAESLYKFKLQLKQSVTMARNKIKLNEASTYEKNNNKTEYLNRNELNHESKDTSLSYTTTGCGTDELIQRTIARDVHIDYKRGIIGQGRYGVVWSAKWNDDLVAVKVFFSMHESSWSRETEIYQTPMLRHDNILGYIASDIKGNGCSINMLLITEYHPLGSLYDYLQANVVHDKRLLAKFLYTTSNGLSHLHQEIFGTKYQPAIVHRDLKTKNILVKRNLECCIADFGLAVRYDGLNNKMDADSSNYDCFHSTEPKSPFEILKPFIKIREGSVRYMAPECLNDTLDVNSIDDLKKADIYAYSLVMWEVLSRSQLNEGCAVNEHKPPFFDYVVGDPAVELMREIVCVRKIRPELQLEKVDDVSTLKYKAFTFKNYRL